MSSQRKRKMFQFWLWGRRFLWSSISNCCTAAFGKRTVHTHRRTHTHTHAYTGLFTFVNTVLQTWPFFCCLPLSSKCKHVSKSALGFFWGQKNRKQFCFFFVFAWTRLSCVRRLLALSGRRNSASVHIFWVNVCLIAFSLCGVLWYRWCFPVFNFFHIAVIHL